MAWRNFLGFCRDGSRVTVYLDTLLDVENHSFHFHIEMGGEIAAELLVRRLDETRTKLVEEVAAKAYADGYRDGRAKRGKRPWHPSRLARDLP